MSRSVGVNESSIILRLHMITVTFWHFRALQSNACSFCTTVIFFTKISDFGLIHWEEGMSKKLFMENLTARGNIGYIPPETFTQCSDPPGTTFDVYRWLAEGIFEIAPSESMSFFLAQCTIRNSHSVTLLSTVYIFTLSQVTGKPLIFFIRLTLSYPFIFPGFILYLKSIVFLLNKTFFIPKSNCHKVHWIHDMRKWNNYDWIASHCLIVLFFQLWYCDLGDSDTTETVCR